MSAYYDTDDASFTHTGNKLATTIVQLNGTYKCFETSSHKFYNSISLVRNTKNYRNMKKIHARETREYAKQKSLVA